MVHEAEVNGRDPVSERPPHALARGMGNFAHDMLTLSELQANLLLVDLQDVSRRMTVPAAAVLIACAMGLGAFPVLLLALAAVFALWLPVWAGCLIAAAIGFLIAGALAAFGYFKARRDMRVFDRSQSEFKKNLSWFKHVIKHNT